MNSNYNAQFWTCVITHYVTLLALIYSPIYCNMCEISEYYKFKLKEVLTLLIRNPQDSVLRIHLKN